MIVVDLGCYDHPDHQGQSQDSIGELIDRYHPDTLYGFDPNPALPVGSGCRDGTRVVLSQKAAWIHDGAVSFGVPTDMGPLSARIDGQPTRVPCFDLAAWLERKLIAHHAILKMDVEGAEYTLLERIKSAGLDAGLKLILVEWHRPRRWATRRRLERTMRCRVELWQ